MRDLMGWGLQAFKSENWNLAIRLYRNALDLDPSQVEARRKLGQCYFKKRNFVRAIAELEQALPLALALDPPDCRVANTLAVVLLASGDAKRALSVALDLTRQCPDKADYLDTLGQVYARLGRTRDAEDALRSAQKAEPGHPDATRHLKILLGH